MTDQEIYRLIVILWMNITIVIPSLLMGVTMSRIYYKKEYRIVFIVIWFLLLNIIILGKANIYSLIRELK